jgi:uncharacterized OsmC-like protein
MVTKQMKMVVNSVSVRIVQDAYKHSVLCIVKMALSVMKGDVKYVNALKHALQSCVPCTVNMVLNKMKMVVISASVEQAHNLEFLKRVAAL